MVDRSIINLTEFIKGRLNDGYTWKEASQLTLDDIDRMSYVFEDKPTTLDQAFPFLFS